MFNTGSDAFKKFPIAPLLKKLTGNGQFAHTQKPGKIHFLRDIKKWISSKVRFNVKYQNP
jgi:hypothetical protein